MGGAGSRFRGGAILAVCALMLAFLAGPPRPVVGQDDAVAAYLDSLTLRRLLVARLEQLVPQTPADDRGPLLEQLAGLYAELLDAAEDPGERRALLDRASDLVRIAGRDGTEPLELAIARADYRTAERAAERWRVRSIDAAAVDAARVTLAEVAARLDDLSRRVERTLERARTNSNKATGTRAIEVSEQLDLSLLLRGEIDYLAGWTAYYRGWLGDPDVDLVAAEERFELLLELGDAGAIPAAVDGDLVAGEGYARAVLGMALVRGLSARTDEVLRWLAPIEAEDAHPDVRMEVPGWRLAVLIDAAQWRRVRDELNELIEEESVPADWYRLVATRALETRGDAIADATARTAVAELGRRGELAVLYEIAERYGTDRLGERGFLVRYVQAAADFSRAAESVGRRVGADAAARGQWRAVADVLILAVGASDAAANAGAAADAERLLGWAHWYAGDADEAWERFAASSERLPPAAAAEAAWMTIVCLDQLVLSGRGEMREEVARRTDAFLERFPGHANAPALRARRIAARPDAAAEQDLEALLAVPRGHPRWRESRETVAAVLARRFRGGSDAAVNAVEAGRAYLDVAAELLDAADAEGAGTARPLTRAEVDAVRLSLEIALDPRVGQPEVAGQALARVSRWQRGGWDPGPVTGELQYRGIQWALAAGRWAEASERALPFASGGPFADAWSRAGLLRVLAAATERGVTARGRVAAAWRLAEPILAAAAAAGEAGASAVATPDGLRLALLASDVGLRRARDDRDAAAFEAVREAMVAARRVHPGERGVLLALGRAATELAENDLALECWRTLSDGLSAPDSDWYEARFQLATVLARTDEPRALRVMRQHAALEPNYGPSPWGQRLASLHERLEAAAPKTDEGGDAGGDP